MKHRLPSLDALKVFESAARHLSFSSAADELCLSKGAVSYRIRRLEEAIGSRLFRREIRRVLLTESGQHLLRAVREAFAVLDDALSAVAEAGDREVSVMATTYVAARWLSPRLTGFAAGHPDIAITLLHPAVGDLSTQRRADIRIEWGPCCGDGLCSEFPMALFPVAAPRVAAALESGARGAVTLLCEDRDFDLWRAWDAGRGIVSGLPRRVIADANVRVQAAVDGQGVMLADALMAAEIDRGLLQRVYGNLLLEGYGYLVRTPQSRIEGRAAALLLDWLTAVAPAGESPS